MKIRVSDLTDDEMIQELRQNNFSIHRGKSKLDIQGEFECAEAARTYLSALKMEAIIRWDIRNEEFCSKYDTNG